MNAYVRRPHQSQPLRWQLASLILYGSALIGIPAFASNESIPWECSNYSPEAQTRCLNGLIEQQRAEISKLRDQLQAHQDTVGQMKSEIEKQAAATAAMQQQLAQRPPTTVIQPPFTYSYAYPPIGFGIYLGRPWVYGRPYYGYGRYFWGPRFYGPHGRRW